MIAARELPPGNPLLTSLGSGGALHGPDFGPGFATFGSVFRSSLLASGSSLENRQLYNLVWGDESWNSLARLSEIRSYGSPDQ